MFLFSKTNKTDGRLENKDDLTSEGYFILDHIANGSYGEVRHAKYVYEDKEINMVVKIIDAQKTSKDYVSKFLPRELDIIRKINHPYIIHVHSILQKKAVLFIFMEYAQKGELLEYILNKGPLNENHARIWFRQMVLALQYLHTMDIVHRDIKCENILLNEHYKIKLTDFGFSKFIKRGKRLNCSTFCCSLCYASPELLNYQNSREYDGKAADIWSLGVVLYVMLNKKIPFSKNNIKIMYKEQVKRYWEHQPAIDKVISENVKSCVINLLQPEPRKRWTIDKVLACDWIKMNKKLVKLNRQESIAFVEALSSDKSEHQIQLKHIEANIPNTQRLLNERPQKFSSTESENSEIIFNSLELDDDSNISRYKLRRSQRILDASNLLQINYKNTVKNDLNTDKDLKRDSNVKKKNSKRDSNSQNRNSKTDLKGSKNKIEPDSNS